MSSPPAVRVPPPAAVPVLTNRVRGVKNRVRPVVVARQCRRHRQFVLLHQGVVRQVIMCSPPAVLVPPPAAVPASINRVHGAKCQPPHVPEVWQCRRHHRFVRLHQDVARQVIMSSPPAVLVPPPAAVPVLTNRVRGAKCPPPPVPEVWRCRRHRQFVLLHQGVVRQVIMYSRPAVRVRPPVAVPVLTNRVRGAKCPPPPVLVEWRCRPHRQFVLLHQGVARQVIMYSRPAVRVRPPAAVPVSTNRVRGAKCPPPPVLVE